MQMSAVRAAIAASAGTVVLPVAAKLTATGYLPDAVTEPHFFCGEYSIEFDRAMRRGLDTVELTTRVLVGLTDDEATQRLLDAMLSGAGPASLKAAIESTRNPGQGALGGLVHDLHVMRVQGYRWYEHQAQQYIGAELIIKIIGEGN